MIGGILPESARTRYFVGAGAIKDDSGVYPIRMALP
jgi:hypothetical protein